MQGTLRGQSLTAPIMPVNSMEDCAACEDSLQASRMVWDMVQISGRVVRQVADRGMGDISDIQDGQGHVSDTQGGQGHLQISRMARGMFKIPGMARDIFRWPGTCFWYPAWPGSCFRYQDGQ